MSQVINDQLIQLNSILVAQSSMYQKVEFIDGANAHTSGPAVDVVIAEHGPERARRITVIVVPGGPAADALDVSDLRFRAGGLDLEGVKQTSSIMVRGIDGTDYGRIEKARVESDLAGGVAFNLITSGS